MSIGVIVDFLFKAGGAALLTDTMKERLPFTRTYDGCEYVHLYTDHDDPNHLFLVQRWASRQKYDKYREWAMAQPGTQQLLPLLEREMTTIYLDETDA